ncbi:hypothetical protein BDR26DRAFT_1010216 [Obelidium mucronatum]|nr:hypothetical protein BDR26DRAFT_1010216 [Obelidium mucronatum]
MKNSISVLITASPIPSHPSPIVLQTVIQSIRDHCPSLLDCHIVLIFDGCRVAEKPMSKLGKVSEDQLEGYRTFVQNTTTCLIRNWGRRDTNNWIDDAWDREAQPPEGSELPPAPEIRCYKPTIPETKFPPMPELRATHRVATVDFPAVTCIQVVGERLGQALAVSEAMKFVETEYVFACQHDWRFNADIDVGSFVNVLEETPSMNYLGFISRRTKGYARQTHPRGYPQAAIPSGILGIPFCRSFFWFDKNHIARTSFYKNSVFAEPFKRGDFIEDTLGQKLHAEIRIHGMDAWNKWGLYLYYPENGELCVLVHVNGRHYLSVDQRHELERLGRMSREE